MHKSVALPASSPPHLTSTLPPHLCPCPSPALCSDLPTLCGGTYCQWAAFDTTGTSGQCPTGSFPLSMP